MSERYADRLKREGGMVASGKFRPPLPADATPIGRDWMEYALELEKALRIIADGRWPANGFSIGMDGAIECARLAVSGETDDWRGVYPGYCIDPETCRGYSHCPRKYSCVE
jgi:hypothetical protein